MNVKAGYRTTEFWVTLISSAVAVLVALGVFTPAEGETASSAGAELVFAIFAMLAAVAPAVAYIYSRTKVKESANLSPIVIDDAGIEPA